MKHTIDLVGETFGRWRVIKKMEKPYWFCECQYGVQRRVSEYSLLDSRSKSCGCLQRAEHSKRLTKHGLSKSPTYKIWTAIKQRCNNPKDKGFKNYGGRGISVCERWNSFENFIEDMGEIQEGLSIERKDNNKGYSLENCIWASRLVQNRNTRRNRNITYHGKEKCLSDWAQTLGVNKETLTYRLNNYPIEKAFTFGKRDWKLTRIIKYQGEEKTIPEWAEELGIAYGTLWWRLKRYPPQIAFNI